MKRKRGVVASLLGGAALVTMGIVWANGTEILGPPDIAIQSGTGVVSAGTGMIAQPGAINIDVPAGATVKQVLLYWEGFMAADAPGDSTILVAKGGPSTEVAGTMIGGPTLFFSGAWASAFRADITNLGLISAGPNALTLDG